MNLDSDVIHKVFIPKNCQKYLKTILKNDKYYRLECATYGIDKDIKFAGVILMKKNHVNARSRKTGYLNIVDNYNIIVGNMYIENTPFSKNIAYVCLKVN